MFDFLSYVRDSGLEIKILPPTEGILIALQVREPGHGFSERCDITDREAASYVNIDTYLSRRLDQMAARIGSKKAKEYADRHTSRQMQEREDFFRGK